jgi:hypothetical protein
MNLKKKMYDRIEKNCIKINLNGEQVYLKNSLGWHVIHSPVDLKSVEENTDSRGNINWDKVKWDKVALIFGSKQNAITTAIVGVITLLIAFGVRQVILSFNTVMSNPIVQACLKSAGIAISSI